MRTPERLDEAAGAWSALAARAGRTPMQDAAWAIACARTVDAEGELRVVLVGDGEQLRAVAPLVRRGPHLELLGAWALGEPSDLLAADPEALAALALAVAELHTPLLLQRLPAGTPTAGALARALRPLGLVVRRTAAPHAAIALDAGWAAPEGRLPARRASDLRRARRRAEALGPVEVQLVRPRSGEGTAALLDAAFAVECRGWKGRAGTALAADACRAAFFRAYADRLAAAGQLQVALLRVAGRVAAMQLAVQWRERLWLLKIGYDEDLARCSPGTLLMLEVVRDAAARGLRAVQLLGAVESWTAMWTDDVQPCMTVAAYPPTASSVAAAAADLAAVARRRAA